MAVTAPGLYVLPTRLPAWVYGSPYRHISFPSSRPGGPDRTTGRVSGRPAPNQRAPHQAACLPRHNQQEAAKVTTPESHAYDLATEACTRIGAKYAAGQQEHGGQLWRKTGIIDMAIDEAIDQVIYLLTLRDQLAAAGIVLGDLTEPDRHG